MGQYGDFVYTGITQSFAAVILGLIFCNSKLLFDFLAVMMEDQQTAPRFFLVRNRRSRDAGP